MTVDQTIIQGLTVSIEAVVNTALRYDPASQKKIAAISDILAVEVTTPALTLYIRGQADGIVVLSYCEAPVATHLQGSPLDLLALLKQPSNLSNSGVTLAGSTSLLQQWQGILQQLDIDWEDAISQIIGDIAGPLASSGIRASAQWAQSQAKEQQRLIAEYLPEELKVTPSKPEVEQLFDGISHLKLDVDRLEARLKRIQQTLDKNHENNHQQEDAS